MDLALPHATTHRHDSQSSCPEFPANVRKEDCFVSSRTKLVTLHLTSLSERKAAPVPVQMLTKLVRSELFHNLDYKSGYAKGYTRGFEESIGYKKGYAAGEKLAREQAANMNAAAAK